MNSRIFKLIAFAGVLLACLILAVPGYSFTHDDNHGRDYRSDRGGYHYYHHPGYYGGGYRYGYARPYRPYYRPYYYGPAVTFGYPYAYPYAAPGFSIYVGP
ncbi:MAG: hypothetical protein LLG06_10790 [Desulfobacteraceae bacterium]|nr:hypothetical protein [Desulfobacteraceae bacterium]